MTFNSSCSYCCIANLLETVGINKEDREIAVEMGLPYLFHYIRRDDCFVAGIMQQGSLYFNLYLETLGFYFYETKIKNKEETVEYIKNNKDFIIGMRNENGKHAMIFKEITDGGRYKFLNPHHANSRDDDYLYYDESELLNCLSDGIVVGFLKQMGEKKNLNKFLHASSIASLNLYRAHFKSFCASYKTTEEISAKKDSLLRPIAIDVLEMIRILGNEPLAKKLEIFQKQVRKAIKNGNDVPANHIDLIFFDEIIDEYKELIQRFIKSPNDH